MIIPNPPLLTSVALTIEQGCPVSFGLEAAGGDNCIFPCSTQAIPPSFNARVTSPSRDGGDTGRGKGRAPLSVARAAGGRLPRDGQAGAPLARGAPDSTGADYPARVAGQAAHRADAGRTRPPSRATFAGAVGVAARSAPGGAVSGDAAVVVRVERDREAASVARLAPSSPRSCAGAEPAGSSAPTRRSPGWRSGPPTPARPACEPWGRSRSGWSGTAPRSAPRSARPGATARPRAGSPASGC